MVMAAVKGLVILEDVMEDSQDIMENVVSKDIMVDVASLDILEAILPLSS
jgi:hypothetical protein